MNNLQENSNTLFNEDTNQPFDVNFNDPYNQIPDKQRFVKDSIHGFINFETPIWDIIDTPQFQRLREIKQLGATFYVFPGATHSRFEHSLGTGYLSNVLVESLEKNHLNKSYTELECDDKEQFDKYKAILQISGLCHDLGHGPYSHMFDNELLPRIDKNITWKHEDGSQMMLDYLFEDNAIIDSWQDNQTPKYEDFNKKDIDLMKQLISGDVPENLNTPRWIYEIISNKKNSIDVDKFDYLKRDAYYIGQQGYDFDSTTLMRYSKILQNTLAYNQKQYMQVYDLFSSRYKLFKQVYHHRVTQGIELMICDAMYQANNIYQFDKRIYDKQAYMNLTDSIVQEIQNNNDPTLLPSQEIFKNIKKRNIYRYLTEQLVEGTQKVDKKNIIKFISQDQQIDESKIAIITCKTSYCQENQNPVDFVDFYKHDDTLMKLKGEQISLVLPNKFQEKHVRVFSKEDQQETNRKIKQGFKKFYKHYGSEGIEKSGSKRRQDRTQGIDFLTYGGTPQKMLPNPNFNYKKEYTSQKKQVEESNDSQTYNGTPKKKVHI